MTKLFFLCFAKEDVPKAINCVTFSNCGDVITADTSGNLMIWDRDTIDAFKCKYAIQAHNVGF